MIHSKMFLYYFQPENTFFILPFQVIFFNKSYVIYQLLKLCTEQSVSPVDTLSTDPVQIEQHSEPTGFDLKDLKDINIALNKTQT